MWVAWNHSWKAVCHSPIPLISKVYSKGKWSAVCQKHQCNLMAVNGQRTRLHVTLCSGLFWIMHFAQVNSRYPVSFIQHNPEDIFIVSIFLQLFFFFLFYIGNKKVLMCASTCPFIFLPCVILFCLCYYDVIMCTCLRLFGCLHVCIRIFVVPETLSEAFFRKL